MKFSDLDVQSALHIGEVAIDVLEFLAKLTGQAGDAATYVAVVRAVLHALDEFKEGRLSAADVRAQLEHFQSTIAQNDAAADAALKAKFPDPT